MLKVQESGWAGAPTAPHQVKQAVSSASDKACLRNIAVVVNYENENVQTPGPHLIGPQNDAWEGWCVDGIGEALGLKAEACTTVAQPHTHVSRVAADMATPWQ